MLTILRDPQHSFISFPHYLENVENGAKFVLNKTVAIGLNDAEF